MKVSDFINNSVYTGINQKLPSYLMGQAGVLNAINFALNDILSYEGKYRTFMYDNLLVDTTIINPEGDETTIEFDVDYPLIRVIRIDDLSANPTERFENINTEPFDVENNLEIWQFWFKPHTNTIKIYNNKAKYRIHYLHYFDLLTMDDEIPLPTLFLWALYDIALTYIYPTYGQLWDSKQTNVYNISRQQLKDLATSDSFQLHGVEGNIH